MSLTIDYYLSPQSPWTYLGHERFCEIARAAKAGNLTPPNRPLELPTGEPITIVDHNVPIRTAAPDPARGDADPNVGIDDIPLLAVLGEDRPAVLVLKFIDADSNRSGANDTTLRLVLQAVAHAAAYDANRVALREEIAKATGFADVEHLEGTVAAAMEAIRAAFDSEF